MGQKGVVPPQFAKYQAAKKSGPAKPGPMPTAAMNQGGVVVGKSIVNHKHTLVPTSSGNMMQCTTCGDKVMP